MGLLFYKIHILFYFFCLLFELIAYLSGKTQAHCTFATRFVVIHTHKSIMSGSNSRGSKRQFAGLDIEVPTYWSSTTDSSMSVNNTSDNFYDSEASFDSDDGEEDYYEEGWQKKEQEKKKQKSKGKGKEKEDNSTFPLQVPDFDMLKRRGMHNPEVLLGPDASISPASIFSKFFDEATLEAIVQNTNAYASSKDAGSGRPWVTLVKKELLIFLSILIYLGLHPTNSLEELWNKGFKAPTHYIAQKMTMKRFQQIKRFLHISELYSDHRPYYAKVEPLLSHVRNISKLLYIPSSNISIDEMMVRFSGHSIDTTWIKNKPIPEGFKIFALCDHGYTYTFLPTSRIHQNEEVQKVDGITYTGSVVLYLAHQLPYWKKTFNLFMDNFFSSIPLFSYLRAKNIGACGTVRSNSRKFPKELKVSKTVKMAWNSRSGIVVDDVLAILWMDNGPVTMLTTIHGLEGDNWKVEKLRRKPRTTSLNAAKVREVFGDNSQQLLKIPCVVNDYNLHMGGVDIADQLRGYYTTQLTSRRNWMPLFFWLLDIVLVNSFKLAQLSGWLGSQVDFREELVWSLIEMAEKEEEEEAEILVQPSAKRIRISKNSTADDLPAVRLKIGNHFPIHNSDRKTCVWCSLKPKKDEGRKSLHVSESQVSCELCNVYLCFNKTRNCFKDFHSLDS
jgi:hypothetical protein